MADHMKQTHEEFVKEEEWLPTPCFDQTQVQVPARPM
jgi:hypothetical protein